ncbi:hypothetical protein ABZ330_00400 [Streptomyces sp. NPDC006172]|uniref:hypothetical protein n=1 Tax=Streptomyces sp. NPDC006172 TaxID=3154470 RepID=UPI0033FED565
MTTRYKIEAPVRSFTGESVGVQFSRGTGYVDDNGKEGRAALEYFRRHGYAVTPASADDEDNASTDGPIEELTNLGHGSAPAVGYGIGTPDQQPPVSPITGGFDPAKHNAEEVVAYLEDSDNPDEIRRVLDAEAAGKNRKAVDEKGTAILRRAEGDAPDAVQPNTPTRDDKKGAGQ